MTNLHLFDGDLSDEMFLRISRAASISWDIETSGLDWQKDRIGLCQLYLPPDEVFLIKSNNARPLKLGKLLEDKNIRKIFHHAPFDLRFMMNQWDISANHVVCTKIASRILNPQETDHSLKTLLKRHLDIDIEKSSVRRSNWIRSSLTENQIRYAVMDVIYLPALLDALKRVMDTPKWSIAEKCFDFLPSEVRLEMEGNPSVFAY